MSKRAFDLDRELQLPMAKDVIAQSTDPRTSDHISDRALKEAFGHFLRITGLPGRFEVGVDVSQRNLKRIIEEVG